VSIPSRPTWSAGFHPVHSPPPLVHFTSSLIPSHHVLLRWKKGTVQRGRKRCGGKVCDSMREKKKDEDLAETSRSVARELIPL